MIRPMRRGAGSMTSPRLPASGPDVEEVFAKMEVIDAVIVGELREEFGFRLDHGLVAPLDAAEVGQDLPARLVLRPPAGLVVKCLGRLLGFKGRLEEGRARGLGAERTRARGH